MNHQTPPLSHNGNPALGHALRPSVFFVFLFFMLSLLSMKRLRGNACVQTRCWMRVRGKRVDCQRLCRYLALSCVRSPPTQPSFASHQRLLFCSVTATSIRHRTYRCCEDGWCDPLTSGNDARFADVARLRFYSLLQVLRRLRNLLARKRLSSCGGTFGETCARVHCLAGCNIPAVAAFLRKEMATSAYCSMILYLGRERVAIANTSQ